MAIPLSRASRDNQIREECLQALDYNGIKYNKEHINFEYLPLIKDGNILEGATNIISKIMSSKDDVVFISIYDNNIKKTIHIKVDPVIILGNQNTITWKSTSKRYSIDSFIKIWEEAVRIFIETNDRVSSILMDDVLKHYSLDMYQIKVLVIDSEKPTETLTKMIEKTYLNVDVDVNDTVINTTNNTNIS